MSSVEDLLKPMNRNKNVEEYLDAVDYTWKGYVPTIEALKYATFIQEVNGGSEDNKTPIVHLAMMDKVFNTKKRSLVLCHRGLAKTTLFAEYLFLHIAAFGNMPGFGKVNLALYVTDSIENGVKNLRRNIEHRYSESEAMQAMVPNRRIMVGSGSGKYLDVTDDDGMEEFARQEEEHANKNFGGRKFTDIRLEFENYKGHKLVVKGYGAKSGVRGAKEMGISRSALCSVFIGQGVLGFDKAYKMVNDAIDTVSADMILKMENDPKVKEEVLRAYENFK